MRKIIRYILIALVVVGIVFLMSTLIDNNEVKNSLKNNNKTYTVSIRVMDRESKEFVNGGEFILKSSDGKIIEEWKGTENIKRISNLKNGTYTIVQKSAKYGYEVSKEITFKIYNDEKEIVIYNEVKSKEVISNEEIVVDNTLSVKSSFSYVISVILIGLGMIFINKKAYALGE